MPPIRYRLVLAGGRATGIRVCKLDPSPLSAYHLPETGRVGYAVQECLFDTCQLNRVLPCVVFLWSRSHESVVRSSLLKTANSVGAWRQSP